MTLVNGARWRIAAVLLLIGCSAVFVAGSYFLRAGDDRRQSSQALLRSEAILLELRERQRLLRIDVPHFEWLERANVFDARPATWVEVMDGVRAQMDATGLPGSLRYQLLGSDPYTHARPDTDTVVPRVYSGTMAMEADLLHEERLLHLFQVLHARGLVSVEACTLNRIASSEALAPRVRAHCRLRWYGLTPPGGEAS